MKIAFVGKGGSGKTTTTALFTNYLLRENQTLLAIDADINMHLADLIGANIDPNKALSDESNSFKIKKFLKGDNKRITGPEHIVKTTPPGLGSNLIRLNSENQILKSFSHKFHPNGFFMFVGTYEDEGIGDSCYHTNLAIFENIMSHSITRQDQWIVADMVAGTDAFAGSLHAQFDAVFLVVEPTPEGVGVYNQYIQLAKTAGVAEFVRVIGNKVEDESDENYLTSKIGDKLTGFIHSFKSVRKARQAGEKLIGEQFTELDQLFEKVADITAKNCQMQDKRIKLLHELHLKHVKADYIINRHGDLVDQIDPNFSYPNQ